MADWNDIPDLGGVNRVLVTGGAGFIGSYVVERLLERGCRVRVIDRLDPQVHGHDAGRPEYLHDEAELIVADLSDRRAVARAVAGVDAVIHLAAAVGVGQSMYEIEAYTRSNELGTAVLLEALSIADPRPRRLTVASSMSIYGEGRYLSAEGNAVDRVERDPADLRADRWDPLDESRRPLVPLATDERKPPDVSSIYALGKHWQEQACLITAGAYGIEATALRFFNVYGPRQALSNPYTGVMAIFANRLLNGQRPRIFEDGLQRRDFVSVHDVADAVVAATLGPVPAQRVLNIGSGQSITVLALARRLAAVLGCPELEPEITGDFRIGDIRHCFADISSAREHLGYAPKVDMDQGVAELAEWLEQQRAAEAVAPSADAGVELQARGLTL